MNTVQFQRDVQCFLIFFLGTNQMGSIVDLENCRYIYDNCQK